MYFAETALGGFLFYLSRVVEATRVAASACSSNSAGGRSPGAWCRRAWLNQPTYSTIASSSWDRVRQTRSATSSVLNESTKDSARAFVVGVADRPDRPHDAVVVEGLGGEHELVATPLHYA